MLLAFIMPSIICLSSRHTGPARGPLLLSKKPKMFGECPQWCKWLPGRERFAAYVLIIMGLVAATGGMSATLGAVQEEGEVVSLVQVRIHRWMDICSICQTWRADIFA